MAMVRAFVETLQKAVGMVPLGGYGAGGHGLFDPFGMGRSLPSASYDYRREVGIAWENSVVYAGLKWMARNWEDARPCVVTTAADGTERNDYSHPWVSLYENPNPYYDGSVLRFANLVSLACMGNSYMYVRQNALGTPLELWWLPPWAMRAMYPENGSKFISHYAYQVNGREVPLPVEQVVHLREGADLLTYLRMGQSDLAACLREVCTDNEATTYMAALLRNGASFSALFSPEQAVQFTDKQREALKRQIMEMGTGDNRFNPLIPSVPMKVQPFNWSPEQLALDKVHAVPESRICACLGISPLVIHIGTSSASTRGTYSNKESAKKESYENGIIPRQTAQCRQYRNQLPQLFADNERPSFDYKGVRCLQENQTEKAKRLVAACGGAYMSVNEAREADGLDRLPGEEHDVVRQAQQPQEQQDERQEQEPAE